MVPTGGGAGGGAASLRRWFSRPALATLAGFALPAFSLGLPSGYSWGALILVLLGVVTLGRGDRRPLPRPMHAFLLALIGFVLVGFTRTEVDWSASLRLADLERPAKIALAGVAALALARFPPSALTVLRGCSAGAWLAGATAFWERHVLHAERADGYTNAIPFGELALLLALWSLLHAALAHGRTERWLARGAAAAALYAMLASGTRGAWAVAPLLLGTLAWVLRRRSPLTTQVSVGGGLPRDGGVGRWVPGAAAFGALLLLLSAWPDIAERLNEGWRDLTWLQQGEADTSLGQRLVHWQLAWGLGWERPWIGWGLSGYIEEKARLVAGGQAPAVLLHFHNAHHEWLDLWVKGGLMGVTSLALLYAVPGLAYARALRAAGRAAALARVAPALAGLLLVIGYVGFGLSHKLFTYNSTFMMYVFMNLIWLAALDPPQPRHATM